jgi:hypothetical protein
MGKWKVIGEKGNPKESRSVIKRSNSFEDLHPKQKKEWLKKKGRNKKLKSYKNDPKF